MTQVATSSQKINPIDSLNTDMKLLNQATGIDNNFWKGGQAGNLSQLGAILKNRNAKFKKQDRLDQKTNTWLKAKGISVESLIAKVKQERLLRDNLMFQMTTKIEDSQASRLFVPEIAHKVFPFPKFSLTNQSQFVQCQHEYLAHELVRQSLDKCTSKSFIRNTKRILFRKLDKEDGDGPVTLHKENETRKNEFARIVEYAVTTGSFDQMAEGFLQESRGTRMQKFWTILYRQLSCASQTEDLQEFSGHAKSTILYRTMLSSLKMLELELEANLPNSLENLEQSHGHQGWGVAYTFYKAGRKSDFFKILSDRKMRKLLTSFLEYERKVEEGRTSDNEFWSNQQDDCTFQPDMYYEQLIYILRGEARYSHSDVCDPWELDLAWVLLRTIGLYLNRKIDQYGPDSTIENISNYQKAIRGIKESYLRHFKQVNQIVLLNMFYLSSYDAFVQIMQNRHANQLFKERVFDYENYIHILLVLYYNPHPLMLHTPYDKFMQETLPGVLAQRLTVYISQKISHISRGNYQGDRKVPSNYLLLMPMSHWEACLPDIVNNIQTMRMFDWQFIQSKMEEYGLKKIFTLAMRSTIYTMYSQTSSEKQLFQVCRLFVQALGSHQECIQGMLTLYLRKTLYKSVGEKSGQHQFLGNKEDIPYEELQSIIHSIFQDQDFAGFKGTYHRFLFFIQTYNKLRKSLEMLNLDTIYDLLVKPNKDVTGFFQVKNGWITSQLQKLLQLIRRLSKQFRFNRIPEVDDSHEQGSEASSINIYFSFLKLVRRSLQVYHHRQGNLKSIRESEKLIDQVSEAAQNWENEEDVNQLNI